MAYAIGIKAGGLPRPAASGFPRHVLTAGERNAFVAPPVSQQTLPRRDDDLVGRRSVERCHGSVVGQFVDGVERRWFITEQSTHPTRRILDVVILKVGEQCQKAAPQIGMQRFASAKREHQLNSTYNAGCRSDPSPINLCPGGQQVRERNNGAQTTYKDEEVQGSIDPGEVPFAILVVSNVFEETETALLLVCQRRRGLFGLSQSVGSCERLRSSSICWRRRSASSSRLWRSSSSRRSLSCCSRRSESLSIRSGINGVVRPLVHGAGLSIRGLQSVWSVGGCEAWGGSRPSQATLITLQTSRERHRIPRASGAAVMVAAGGR